MSDITQRLRESVTQARALDRSELLHEAAAEIERLRSYEKTDGKRGDSDTDREPVAWGVLRVGGGWVSILANEVQAETSRKSWDARENWVHEVIPLYRSPELTDAEREAVEWAHDLLLMRAEQASADALRGLLERLR